MVHGKKQRITAALLTTGSLLALTAAGSGARGNIVVTVTGNGSYATSYSGGSGSYDFGSGNYNGVSWTSLSVDELTTSSGGYQLSMTIDGINNTQSSGGSVLFAVVDNNFNISSPATAANLQTSFTANATTAVSGQGSYFVGGASYAGDSTPTASQSGTVGFVTSTGSYSYLANKPLMDIRSYGITGNINIYSNAGASFDSGTTVNSLSMVTDVFPGAANLPEPSPLVLLIGLGTLGLLRRPLKPKRSLFA